MSQPDQPNERRADWGHHALRHGSSDWGANDLATDVADTLANLMHFCDRAQLEFREVLDRAYSTYEGDTEDGPPAQVGENLYP